MSKILIEISRSVRPFSAVLAITLSFQIRFRLVNYQTEYLHILFQMTVKWSIKSRWSSTMDLVKLRSNLVKLIKILLSLKHGLGLTDFNMFGYFQPVLALIGPPRFACRIPKKIFRVKMGL